VVILGCHNGFWLFKQFTDDDGDDDDDDVNWG